MYCQACFNAVTWQKLTLVLWLAPIVPAILAGPACGAVVEGTQWAPYLEWTLEKQTRSETPYDVRATVTFTHTATGTQRTTETFYDGAGHWKFRFTATRTRLWTFATTSRDPELDGKTGTIHIAPNPNRNCHGFITKFDGSTWAWQGTKEAFVPQLVMYKTPQRIAGRPDVIDADIHTFLVEHGFNGFHVATIAGWWFNHDLRDIRLNRQMTEPDPRTFEALELLITKVHAAGGMVHIWLWGDHQRHQTPRDLAGGINGAIDRRLQRYIAARLGPLPGWTLGYGFDLQEWVEEKELRTWHQHMHRHLGWSHFLGARAPGLTQICDDLDYSSYQQHRPDCDIYVKAIEQYPDKPTLLEDRFRIRKNVYPDKDYDAEMTRRGLWHSTMAGGAANIWGNLLRGGQLVDWEMGSAPYPNREQIKTYSVFFHDKGRFVRGMKRANRLSPDKNTRVLRHGHSGYVFYREDTATIHLNLSEMDEPAPAVAVDTKKPYAEIAVGMLAPAEHTWQAPYPSDWALAVGTWPMRSGSGTDNDTR